MPFPNVVCNTFLRLVSDRLRTDYQLDRYAVYRAIFVWFYPRVELFFWGGGGGGMIFLCLSFGAPNPHILITIDVCLPPITGGGCTRLFRSFGFRTIVSIKYLN